MAEIAQKDNSGLLNLAQLFLSKSTNTSTTTGTQNSGGVTTSESVSQDGVNALVKSILEGNQGLAAVAGAQKGAGIYNSSTNTLLTNDLITRAAAQGAALNKTSTTADTRATTQTTAQATTTPAQINPGLAAAISGGLSLIPKDFKDKITSGNLFGSGSSAERDRILNEFNGNTKGVDGVNSGNGISVDPNSGSNSSTSLSPESNAIAVGTGIGPQQDTGAPIDLGIGNSDSFNSISDSIGNFIGSDDYLNQIGLTDSGVNFSPYEGDFSEFGFAKGGLVTNAAKPKTNNYKFAEGGLIDLTDTGLRRSASIAPISLSADSNSSSVNSTGKASPQKSSNSGTVSNSTISGDSGGGKRSDGSTQDNDGNTSGVTVGSTPGVGAGIGLTNGQASIAGSIVSALSGLPGLSSVASLANAKTNDQAVAAVGKAGLGLALSSLGPLGLVASFAVDKALSAISNQASSKSFGSVNNGIANNGIGIAGDPVDGPGTLGSRDSYATDDSAVGSNSNSDSGATGAEGSGIGGSGNSAGDGIGTGAGDAGGDGSNGGDSASAATGGKISGPGTGTSDSIPIHVSNGEYVIKKSSVDALGVDFLDMINAIGVPHG